MKSDLRKKMLAALEFYGAEENYLPIATDDPVVQPEPEINEGNWGAGEPVFLPDETLTVPAPSTVQNDGGQLARAVLAELHNSKQDKRK